jgi:hypothetical protein
MVTVTYRGPEAGVGSMAKFLSDEGLSVEFDPPMENRGWGSDAAFVLFYVGDKILDAAVGVSVESLAKNAVENFKRKFPRNAQIDVENDLDI